MYTQAGSVHDYIQEGPGMMKILLAADQAWGIGNKGRLLIRIDEDMRRFRELTLGKIVICGRRTLQSFPGGRPLAGRVNIVLSRDPGFLAEGAVTARSVDEVLALLAEDHQGRDDEVFVIGGGQVCRAFLPYCDKALITRIETVFEADTFACDLDADPAWERCERGEDRIFRDLTYHFDTYRRTGTE